MQGTYKPILELETVHKSYGSFVAVDRLSLQIPRATIYGLLGPNGAGKTSTIRMIMNIIVPDSGRILFDGAPWRESLLDRIGYLPEERGLYRKMKVVDLLLFLAEIKSVSSQQALPQIVSWLERMGLSQWKNKKLDELSKGMQQKVQFISCVVHNPDLFILDEPFAGLDPLNVAQLKETLLGLKREGKTILLSTHRMDQAEVLCDSICLINKSLKVLDGSLQEIKRRHARNSVYLEADPAAEAYVSQHPAARSVTRRGDGWEVLLDTSVTASQFLRDCAQRFDVNRFEVSEATLDEIFIQNVEEAA